MSCEFKSFLQIYRTYIIGSHHKYDGCSTNKLKTKIEVSLQYVPFLDMLIKRVTVVLPTTHMMGMMDL